MAMRPDEDRICHSETLRNIAVGSTDPSVTAAASKRNLETSVECETPEGLTLYALKQSDRNGDLKSLKEGQINLLLDPGCRGSFGATLVTTDERLRELQSAQSKDMGTT